MLRNRLRSGMALAGHAPPDFRPAGADEANDKNAGRYLVEQKTAHETLFAAKVRPLPDL